MITAFVRRLTRDSLDLQMAAVAALCVQYEADFRPNMSIVVKALQPLLTARTAVAPAGSPGKDNWTRRTSKLIFCLSRVMVAIYMFRGCGLIRVFHGESQLRVCSSWTAVLPTTSIVSVSVLAGTVGGSAVGRRGLMWERAMYGAESMRIVWMDHFWECHGWMLVLDKTVKPYLPNECPGSPED